MIFYKTSIFILSLIYFTCLSSYGQENSHFIKLDYTFLVNSNIVEDNLGFILIAGVDGIYKYDGYDFNFTSHKNIFGTNFISDRGFLLAKDNNNCIWISSIKGELTKICEEGIKVSYKDKLTHDKATLRITSFKPHEKDLWLGSVNGVLFKHENLTSKTDSITTLPKIKGLPQKIESIAIAQNNNLLLSSNIGNIYNYSTSTNKLTKVNTPFNNTIQIIKLVNDKAGNFWVATEWQGLFRYDSDGLFKQYRKFKNLTHPMFTSVFCDSSGIIWAGTDGDGLYKINPENEDITIFKEDESNKSSISNNTITNINEDSKGNIWILLKNDILNILPKNNSKINYYNGLETNNSTKVLSILKSSDGSLWFGTDGKGLNLVMPNNTKTQYDISKQGGYFFKGRYINQLKEDAKGNIWIGTYLNGLWVFNPNLNTFTKVLTSDSNGVHSPDIRLLFKDSKNRIWAASGVAINVFNDNQELLATFDYNSDGLFGRISMSACEDETGAIWFGINPGRLFSFNENLSNFEKSYFTKHNYYTKEAGDTRNYNVHSLVHDDNGNIWILCASGMLIKYDLSNNSFESFAKKPRFKGVVFTSILLEDTNNLWLSSTNGMHHYNVETELFKSYYQTDGFKSNNFTRRSSFKDNNGILYFGGEDGVNSFSPSNLSKKESSATLHISSIEILNKPASSIIEKQVNKGVQHVKALKLDYDQSSFSFQFAALDNVLNPNYHYAYKLKGFDTDWITPKKERIASYTNIPYGNYTFEIRAGSKKGEWDIAPKTIDIYIKPPWWLSSLAFILYFIAGSLLIYSIAVWLRLKNKLAKEAWQNNKEKEIYALKMSFFAKMSHEIQTPLTLILGPIGDMLEKAESRGNRLLEQRLLMIKNNANRLSRIAMELMTVRNKELGKLRIFASKNELLKDLKRIALSFSEQARFKNIDFIQEYPDKDVHLWYDSDKIEHVIYNLLSNAFKFTPKEGRITLKAVFDSTEEFIEVLVFDSGPGIHKEEFDDIFELFYQSNLGKQNKGIGIGLALTKELISLHHGEINVTSSAQSGTCFSVKLSTNENLFSEDEKLIIENSNTITKSLEQDFKDLEEELNLSNNSLSKKLHTLLIVEDNIEMQMFLRDVLSNHYNLLIAENGKEGVSLATKNNPDLIISDIMMPIIDGIEMCKILQKKKSTSHIPIILLTAKNTTSSKLKGLKSGAIEYIRKPFNFHELSLKVNNILSTKEKLLSQYKTNLISSPEEISSPSKDDIFLKNLVKELNSQIENPNFRLEDLSKSLNMSYSVIFRKCQDITGKTLIEYVRTLKLKKAALLITQHGYNISQASFMVGYKDSKYFTKCFKEEFGIPPAGFKRESKKIGLAELMKKYKIQL